ncbi:hypothetical protein [Usitatibacter palustris]|uniref:Alginate export n=1 Tax=Usitatibacter palustris TaxID=2732487 RepID=A0A6M4H5S6_9PROT|nr:hypothetical protein [Usitatibacter palustris]QJR15019.1 hypothetical protein DSM104440_01835 [Usitatibacter palustris]
MIAALLFAWPAAAQEDPKLPPEKKLDEEINQRRPGPGEPLRYVPPVPDSLQVPPPRPSERREMLPVPDRWRIMQALGFKWPWYDPYNQNVLKGDLPIRAPDWFVNVGVVSDTLYEARRLPTPVGSQPTSRDGAIDVFGQGKQSTFSETLIVSLALIKGNTTFKPPDYEFRIVPAFNFNRSEVEELRALRVDPRQGTRRSDNHVGLQEAFADVHLRNVSDRYDFDSIRVGIQPFISDFRGFVFQDVPFGVRLFGTRDNNKWQYNIGWFRRLEKDTNSGLNDPWTAPRRDDTFVVNAYHQDFPVLGFTSQATAIYNVNRDGGRDYYNNNGFLERPAVMGDARPHDYRVGYLGYSGDGHIGRWNLSTSVYVALGRDERHPLAQRPQDIRAAFAAAEVSRDFSWARVRLNALLQSGDKDPFDGKATGFDAILENPQFAGADTSFWVRQAVPLVGGGGVALSGRNGVLASLRSSKDQGQSNFVNPGLLLLGVGADADLSPQVRAVGNLSYLRFQDTTVLGVLRNQAPPSREVGWDLSGAIQWRPFMSQNIVFNASAAVLLPGKGLKQLYDEDKRGPQYSVLANLVLSF